MAHIVVWDVSPLLLQDFFIQRGWKYEKGSPLRLLYQARKVMNLIK